MSSTRHSSRERIWLLLLWVSVTAVNLYKPYVVDDAAHLFIARWIGTHPWHPMTGLLNWSGRLEPIFQTNQPHLYFYLLAFWGRALGYSEPAMHLLQSLAALVCIVYVFRLAKALVPQHAVWITALVTLGPAFVVEQNLMVDVPLLAAWSAFFYYLACEIATPRQTVRFVRVGVACSVALLIKYSSLVLLPIFLLALVLERRRNQLWTFLLPIATLAAWSWFNYLDYGGVHLLARPTHHSMGDAHPLYLTAPQWVLTLGGLTPLGMVAVARRAGTAWTTRLLALFAVCFTLLAAVAQLGLGSQRVLNLLLNLAFAISGTVCCVALLPELAAVGRRFQASRVWTPPELTSLYLLLWVVLTSLFYIAVAPFIASRHVLLILPPLTLLLTRRWKPALSFQVRAFCLAMTVFVSAGLEMSDWRFGSFFKTEALRPSFTLSPRVQVWTNAHWGWQWYAEQAGVREFNSGGPLPQPGSLVLIPREVDGTDMSVLMPLKLLGTVTDTRPMVEPLCIGRTGNFYTTIGYRGPWTLDGQCIAHLNVYRVQ